MKYQEFQVWYHAFNNAILAMGKNDYEATVQLVNDADFIANHTIEKFKKVDMSQEKEVMENFNNTAKEVIGKYFSGEK